jgi:hypothetical protein
MSLLYPEHYDHRAAMLSTVGFDKESSFDASKVHHIGRNRMLPSEAPAELVLPQRIPKKTHRNPSFSDANGERVRS